MLEIKKLRVIDCGHEKVEVFTSRDLLNVNFGGELCEFWGGICRRNRGGENFERGDKPRHNEHRND